MGFSSEPFLVPLSLRNLLLDEENKQEGYSSSYGYLRSRALAAAQAKKHKRIRRRGGGRMLMKRRARLIGGYYSRKRLGKGIDRRVRTLKRLVPNTNDESLSLDGLFRETAHYILSLQMRVRVMQIMVKVLTGSDE